MGMTPFVFEGCAGWLHPAGGDVGVLLCSPIGLEELCLRRAWRMLAERCAEAGFPALRFDYPGCGDSLGGLETVAGVRGLVQAVVRAAEALRKGAGVSRLVLVGHGLGAALATLAARRVEAEALALLAPVVRGGAELRALSLWSHRIAIGLDLPAGEAEREGVAGFALPPALRASIAALDLTVARPLPAERVFLAARAHRPLDYRLADRLRAEWADLTVFEYDGYAAAVEAPTRARPPAALFEALVRWLRCAAPMPPPGEVPSYDDTATHFGRGFIETFVRFGPAGRLAGVLCEPEGRREGAAALLLNAGGDPHAGWARSSVDLARMLARLGAASFRIDMTGFGDSASPRASRGVSAGPPRLCDPQHVADALAAVDWLEGRGLGPVLAVGRSSGASVALAAAARDVRIRELVLVNQRRFSTDFADFGETAGESLAHYRERLSAPAAALRRGLRGELDLWPALRALAGATARRAYAAASGHEQRRRSRLLESFEAFAARGMRTTLLYSEKGPAWSEFERTFGAGGGRLRRLAGLEIGRIAGADLNLTPAAARAALVELLCQRALNPPAPAPAPPASSPDRARSGLVPFGSTPRPA